MISLKNIFKLRAAPVLEASAPFMSEFSDKDITNSLSLRVELMEAAEGKPSQLRTEARVRFYEWAKPWTPLGATTIFRDSGVEVVITTPDIDQVDSTQLFELVHNMHVRFDFEAVTLVRPVPRKVMPEPVQDAIPEVWLRFPSKGEPTLLLAERRGSEVTSREIDSGAKEQLWLRFHDLSLPPRTGFFVDSA